MLTRTFAFCALLAAFGGCVVNPVTGNRELALVSADQEIAIGEQQYEPAQQMEGGAYAVDRSLTSYVAGVGQKLAAVSDRALPYEFVVLNNSVPNAWALPGGKIAVNRGLLTELNSEAELAAVLGHEIVHAAARHGALALQRGLLLQGAVLATQVAAQRGSYEGLAVGAAGVGAQLLMQRHSRDNELEADLYGMRYMSAAGYDPSAAVTLQQTFVRLNGADQGRLATMFASHPPSAERVQKNRETAAALPKGGEIGRERYEAATASLRQRQPAYEAYDQGRQALANGDTAEAERRAQDAVRRFAGEAQFHALLGDIDTERKRYADAVRHYDDAIARNDGFFYYHLQKGLAQRQLRQWADARAELEQSVALLPTADAYYALGAIAEQRGDREAALEYYARAAQSSGEAGQAAQDAAVRLDLPSNPSKYINARGTRNGAGELVVEIANPTRVAVADLDVVVRYSEAGGTTREVTRRFPGPLGPGQSGRWSTGINLTSTAAFQVNVTGARVSEAS